MWYKLIAAIVVIFCVLFVCVSLQENTPITSVENVMPNNCSVWQGDAYINAHNVTADRGVFVQCDHVMLVAVASLNKYISDRFIYQEDGGWFVRQNRLDHIQFYQIHNEQYISIAEFEKYLFLDERYLAMGIVLLQTNIPSHVNWEGTGFVFTGESSTAIDRPMDGITDDGRKLWLIEADLWVEDDDGSMYRYEKPRYKPD